MVSKPKGVALPVFVVVAVIALIFAFNASAGANKYKKLFEKEMAFRLDMEEKVDNLRNEKVNLANILKDKNLEIQKKDQLISALNDGVAGKDAEVNRLQSELKKLDLLKQKLEDNLKDALSEQEEVSEQITE
ncbi:hypothetical protein HQ550_03850 [bacterium]|nr:hypothetical protein [bacterium]